MKRVFTIGYADTVDATAGVTVDDLTSVLLAEEDITVIGFQMSCKTVVGGMIANDGESDVDWVLTTTGQSTGPGVLGYWNAFAMWNTAPASVVLTHPDVTVMFPEGFGFTMKEGELLSMRAVAHNNSAALVRHTVDGVIYYVKGGAKK